MIFRQILQNLDFPEISTKITIFLKLTKSKIFDKFQQNQKFSKTLTKIKIFGNFDQIGWRFFFTEIEIL